MFERVLSGSCVETGYWEEEGGCRSNLGKRRQQMMGRSGLPWEVSSRAEPTDFTGREVLTEERRETFKR